MKIYNKTIIAIALTLFSSLSFADHLAGKFAIKKIIFPITIFSMSQDAIAKCEENRCTEEMTLDKGVEITGAVAHAQWVEFTGAVVEVIDLIEIISED
jgi:hypothetical protein